MIAEIKSKNRQFKVDLSQPLDISIPLRTGKENVSAWYVDPIKIEPVRTEQFTGSVEEGGSVNFRDISFNPHGNGTHTEWNENGEKTIEGEFALGVLTSKKNWGENI